MVKPNVDDLTKVYAKYFSGLYALPKSGTQEYKYAYKTLRDKLQKDLETLGIAANFDFELVLVGAKTKEAMKNQTAAKIDTKQASTSAKPEPKPKTQTSAKPMSVETAVKPEEIKAQKPAKLSPKIETAKAPKKMLFTKGVFANGKLDRDKSFANGKL